MAANRLQQVIKRAMALCRPEEQVLLCGCLIGDDGKIEYFRMTRNFPLTEEIIDVVLDLIEPDLRDEQRAGGEKRSTP